MTTVEIAFVAGSGVTGTALFLAVWHMSGFMRRKRGEEDDASGLASADQDEGVRAQTARTGFEALEALAAKVAALETGLSSDATEASDLAAELEACRREAAELREETGRLGARCAELEAGAAVQARLQAEAETTADRLAALEELDLASAVDEAVQARVGAVLEGFDPASAAEAQARTDARLEALEGADPAAAHASALEARIDSVAERMLERIAALETFAPAQAEAMARAAIDAAVEALTERLAAVERLSPAAADLSRRVEAEVADALEGVSARLGALEAGAAVQADAGAAGARLGEALEDLAGRLTALEAEARTGVEKAMGPAIARVAALRGDVEAAVEARLAPLLSRLGALEEERMVLRRTVDLPAPKAVAGLRVEVDALADRLSTLAAEGARAEEPSAAAKPRVTMLSSTKI